MVSDWTYLLYLFLNTRQVIDGDGHIFNSALLSQGARGGEMAGAMLEQGIAKYLAGAASSLQDARVWVTIYFNLRDLRNVLATHKMCTVNQFDEFLLGFSRHSPFFSLVDVGHGDQAADVKIQGK